MAASSPCPTCGRPASVARKVAPTTADLDHDLQDIIGILTPPTQVLPIRVLQSNGSLTVKANTPFQVLNIPPKTKTWLLANLSSTKSVSYWFSKATTPPTNAYRTLGAGLSIARDTNPPFLSVQPDTTDNAAGLEIEFWY